MKTKKEIQIGAIGVLVISGLVLLGILMFLLMLMFYPELSQAKEIALGRSDFFVWSVVWIIVSVGLIVSAIGLLFYKKWGRYSMIAFSFLGLLGGFWGIWRTNKINYLVFLYYLGTLIYFSRSNLSKVLSQ